VTYPIEIRRLFLVKAGVRSIVRFAPGTGDPVSLVLTIERPRTTSDRWLLLASAKDPVSMKPETEREPFLGTAWRFFDLLALDPERFDFESVEEAEFGGIETLKLTGKIRSDLAPYEQSIFHVRKADGHLLRIDWLKGGHRVALLMPTEVESFDGRDRASKWTLIDFIAGARTEMKVRSWRTDTGLDAATFRPDSMHAHR
jgi:hypothetical protein